MRPGRAAAIFPRMKIGHYEVLGELGRGGMGVVYRVRGPDGREAALKALLRTDAATFARFERERRLLASLGENEGFVPLLDAGTSAEMAWLVMPLVPGGTLRKRLDSGPLPVEESVKLGLALARALGAAHERGIVHRDVKPENILFAAAGRPLVADLGLSKHFDRSAPGGSQSLSATGHGTLKGTAGYMAPEQIEDAASAGPPADVFALGAVLYECLAGRPAFAGATLMEVLTKVSSGTLEPIGRPDVPGWLEGVLRRALASDQHARFADGAGLAQALRGPAAKAGPRRAVLGPLVLGVVVGASVLAAGMLVPARSPTRAGTPGLPPNHTPDAPVERSSSAQELLASAREKNKSHDWEGAIADATKAIELDPGLAQAWANRCGSRGMTGDWDGQIADATKAIELDPGLATAWANRASARGKKDDRDGELADATRAIELDPRLAEAWVTRGAARGQKGDWEGEIADETRAIELNPGLGAAWVNRGAAREEKGDFDGAIADATKAIELDPRQAVAWLDRGSARGEKGDWDGEIADVTRAIELDPKLTLAWVNRGFARGQKGDWDGEIADETKAVELDPRLAMAWANRGFARDRKDDWDGAIADETKAIELDPALAMAWANRGISRRRQGDWDGTIADETKAIELDPKRVSAWANRGLARGRKGDRDGEIADYERSLELDPAGPNAAKVRAWLEDAKKRAR